MHRNRSRSSRTSFKTQLNLSHPIQRLEYHGLTHQFLSLVGSFCDVAGILAALPELRGFRSLCWGRFAAVFYRLTGKTLTSCAQAATRYETTESM